MNTQFKIENIDNPAMRNLYFEIMIFFDFQELFFHNRYYQIGHNRSLKCKIPVEKSNLFR